MKTVGIVGGIGPESTIDYYRSIIARYMSRYKTPHYPRVVINSVDLTDMVRMLENDRLDELVESLRRSVESLSRAGSDFAVFASNTPHVVFDRVSAASPLPMISIVEETRKKASAMGLSKLGLFGTRHTMRRGFYQAAFERHGMTIVVPGEEDQEYIHDHYMNELVRGRLLDKTKREFLRIAGGLEKEGIEGLILGGTELPLLLKNEDAGAVPFLNTTQIHVESIVDMLG